MMYRVVAVFERVPTVRIDGPTVVRKSYRLERRREAGEPWKRMEQVFRTERLAKVEMARLNGRWV